MEQTIVIECSRQSSLEATTFNNQNLAEWTNDCGAGVVLDIGDKIQVHSGFVSEKGAQAGEIEIKERDRKNSVSVNVSKDIEYKQPNPPITSINPSLGPDEPVGSRPGLTEIYDFACEVGGNELRPLNINDGETNIIYSPYKTANGEYYATLPRRHIGWDSYRAAFGVLAPVANEFTSFDANQGPYVHSAGFTFNLGATVTGNVKYALSGEKPEYNFGMDNTNAWQFNPADYKLVQENATEIQPGTASGHYTRRKGMVLNDNSRYTLFRADKIYRTAAAAVAEGGNARDLLGGDASNSPSDVGTEAWTDASDLRDPAILFNWSQVRNLVTIKSKAGFNKPEDVATELTQQLNLRGEPVEKKIIHRLRPSGGTDRYVEKTLYKYYDSPCLKSYNCATSVWTSGLWFDFKHASIYDKSVGDEELDNAQSYMSMYQHIGIKRPELHIQGRATNGSQGFLKPAISGGGGDTPQNAQCLNLGLHWTDDNLNALNELFKVQVKYPELFTGITQQGPHSESPKIYHKITPGNHRFLHFNLQDDQTTALDHAAGRHRHNPKSSLGYDLYGFDDEQTDPPDPQLPLEPLPATGFYHYDNTMATYPVFLDFNPNTINMRPQDVSYTDDALGGFSDINDLAYGWARKMRIPGARHPSGEDTFFIGIQFTYTGNGVPEFLYNGMSHIALSTIPGNPGRRFGWDYHFSAYGNPCMIMYSGLVGTEQPNAEVIDEKGFYQVAATCDDKNADQVRNVAGMYHTIQLGADEPAVGYDPDEERFFMSNLHISEKLGNPSDAGAIAIVNASGITTTNGVNPNQNATANVYKINKRMLGNNYCPNVAPYSQKLLIPAEMSQQYPAQTIFSNNLEAGTPYDAMGGMFIEEVAIPETIWDENLMGVLGFSYDQFNNTDTTRQVSIKDRFNATNLKSLTTQAPVNVEDLINWNKNGFGNNNFGLTPTINYLRNKGTHKVQGIYPPATIILPDTANSTRITAVDLPTKTERPYYAIRSNIIPQNQFLGGNGDYSIATAGAVNRPVVAIVNKINGYGDFYSSESQQLTFTNTEKRVITSIKTSVHDPDGSYSKVNKSSSVIYKVMKTKQIDLTPVKTLLESKNKQQVKEGDLAASMIKDPSTEKPDYNYALDGLLKNPPKKFITEEEFFAARSSE